MFKLWSQVREDAAKELKPDLGLRNWNGLKADERLIIWKHLYLYFFEIKPDYEGSNYTFWGDDDEKYLKGKRILYSISALNDLYKAKNFTPNFLDNSNLDSACRDFYSIFKNHSDNVVLELLSLYGKTILIEREEREPYQNPGETKEDFQKRTKEWRFAAFDEFAKKLNEIFSEFGINVYITRAGFIPRQDEKITKSIYSPVLNVFSDPKWKDVNSLLVDAFAEYKKNTPQGFSNCVTNAVSSIQAFLQLLNDGKTGKGNIVNLISIAQKDKLIPDDFFTKTIFKNIESILAYERQETSTAHPKKRYSSEKNARLILNLAMVFFQHCIQK